jgi:uncharacterized protein YqgV (UPF0045/DUF77 family)
VNISVELSLYPLDDKFLSIIQDIVKRLNDDERVNCFTNTMSTQIFGEMDNVMSVLKDIVRYSFSEYGKQVFVAKILNSDVQPTT